MTLNEILSLPDDHYVPENEWALARKRSLNLIRREAVNRRGAPRTKIGNAIMYRVGAIRAWLRAQERDFDKERKGGRRRRRVA